MRLVRLFLLINLVSLGIRPSHIDCKAPSSPAPVAGARFVICCIPSLGRESGEYRLPARLKQVHKLLQRELFDANTGFHDVHIGDCGGVPKVNMGRSFPAHSVPYCEVNKRPTSMFMVPS